MPQFKMLEDPGIELCKSGDQYKYARENMRIKTYSPVIQMINILLGLQEIHATVHVGIWE